jgi:two-component system, NarL family, nitrate/nitrite response regulator NarL
VTLGLALTPRERDVLAVVLSGATNKEIARQFGIKEQAVKNYLTSIYEKVGVTNRVALTVAALKHDLLGQQPDTIPARQRRAP